MSKRKHKARTPTSATGKTGMSVKNTGYSDGGASRTSGILKAWLPRKSSAKADINANLELLRDRAADQAINTPIGAAAINTTSMHTIGAGLKLFPKVKYKLLGIDPRAAREWNKKTAAEFEFWATSKLCDIRKRNNFYDLQEILYKAYMTDGDSFNLFRRAVPTANMPYSLRLQALEGNRVSNPFGRDYFGIMGPYAVEMTAPDTGNTIVNGVEVDQDGAIIAFWISNKVPYDPVDIGNTATWTRVEAFGGLTGKPNVLQICHDERPEQYRGVPYLAPVIETLKQVSRYTTAELTAAIMKSFFALFFTSTGTTGSIADTLGPAPYDQGEGDSTEPVVDATEYELGPGTMNALPKGVDVKSVDASNSQSTFEPFTRELIKQIAAAIGQPYEVLMKSFNSSYSASRAALLQAWEQYKLRRVWFTRDFCQPVYEMWLEEAVAIGRIEAPGFFEDPLLRFAYSNAEWYGPSMSILDPVKDVNGSALRTTYALSTREREAAEMTGSDFEENLEELRIEKEMIEEAGLSTGNPEVLAGKLAEAESGKGGEKE